jgi:hypothetical protein
VLDQNVITGPGSYAIGGMDMIACPGTTIAASADFRTNRKFCKDPLTGMTGPMAFTYLEGGLSEPCNCAIDKPGSLYLEEYGKELTNVIQGAVVAPLAGWIKCECSVGGKEECARAYIDINFRILVGAQ